MGLDFAEILISIEEEFDIWIFEVEAGKIETIRDLVTVVQRQVADSPVTQEQAEQRKVEGLRQARTSLSDLLGLPISELSEARKLGTLFPIENRSELWQCLREKHEGRLPELYDDVSYLTSSLIALTVFGIFVGSVLALEFLPVPVIVLIDMILATLLILLLRWHLASRKRLHFSPGCETVGELARCLVPCDVRLGPQGKPWTKEDIEKTIVLFVSKIVGGKPEDISPSMTFQELGLS